MTTSTWLRCLGPTIVILDWLSWSWKDYLAAINAKCQLEATMLPLHRIRIRITCNSCWKTWRIVLRFCRILGMSCCWISNSLAAGLTPSTSQFPSCFALLQGSPKDFLTILYLYFDYCAKDQFSLPDDDSQIFNQVILGHGSGGQTFRDSQKQSDSLTWSDQDFILRISSFFNILLVRKNFYSF